MFRFLLRKRSYWANIRWLYIIKFSKWFLLVMPVIGLYYNANGLSLFEIFAVQAVYSGAMALFEIPSGYLADVWGRRKSIILGTLLGAVGYAMYSYSHSVWTFAAAELVLGIGNSCISGADSAILYDSLLIANAREKYLKHEGRTMAFGNLSETIAALAGGSLAVWMGLRGVFAAQAAVACVGFIAALLLLEPPRQSPAHASLRQLIAVSKYTLFGNKALSSATYFSSIVGIITLSIAWVTQAWFVHNHLTEATTTPIWIGINLCAAITAFFANKILSATSFKVLTWIVILGLPFGYLVTGFFPFWAALLGLVVFYFIRGFTTPLLKDVLNAQCSSDVRATVLSVRSMIIRIGFAIVGPSIGWIEGVFSFSTALLTAFCFFFISMIISGYFFLKHKQ